MCGIAGLVAKHTSIDLPRILARLSKSLAHRGPDGEGFMLGNARGSMPFASEETPKGNRTDLPYWPQTSLPTEQAAIYHFGLAHRRLAILDLSLSGHQPLCVNEQRYWITFNGEIYNYLELREELKNAGHTFASSTDTEVVLKAYQQWGIACVERFNGMWAFCIYDGITQQFICSRDRFGVKPFYFINTALCFAFASEQKAFVKAGLIKAEMRPTALHDYLLNNRLEQKPENFFQEVLELFPGQHLIYDIKSHTYQTQTYYHLKSAQTFEEAPEESVLIKTIYDTLQTAIKLRLRSDVAVGTCLSGGLDSSSIAVIMQQFTPNRIHCFTSDFTPGGEGHYAKTVAQHINAQHHLCYPTATALFDDLETLTYALDAPTWDTSTYAQFRVMQLAKEHGIKVVLDGQGADELFAGYHHHYLPYWSNLSFTARLKAISDAEKSIPHPFLFYLKERYKQRVNRYENAVGGFVTTAFKHSGVIENGSIYKATVNEQLQHDIETARLKTFLRCEDRCGMWHGVESRTPFSDDIDLIHLAFRIDGQAKLQQGTLKYLLREAMKPLLPAQIYNRKDKMGFSTPMYAWVHQQKAQIMQTVLDRRFDFINAKALQMAFKKDGATLTQLGFLYKLYVLVLWEKVFCR